METVSSEKEERRAGTPKRQGSRVFLAAGLLGGVAAALFLGTSIPEILAGLAGFASRTLRLVLKVIGVIVALPIGFYLVERYFVKRTSRTAKKEHGTET